MPEIATYLTKLEHVLSETLMKEWEAQGHSMSGKIVSDIEYVVKQEVNSLTISGMIYPYGNIIARGVESSKIPYSGHSKKGGTSKYIEALQNYVKLRMNISDEKKSLGVAFAIAQTQKFSGDFMGMPTRGSYAYTKTGKRLGWISEALKNGEISIVDAIREMAYNLLSVQIDDLVTKWNVELNKS